MILRRLTAALRKQDWVTVVIETLIVVLGVFLGIQLGNWNEARADRQKESVIEKRLLSDFEAIVESERHHLKTVEAARVGADTLLDRTAKRDIPAEPADLCALMSPSRAFRPPVPASATYTQLVTNGDMRLITDERLRLSLAEFESQRASHDIYFEMSLATSLSLSRVYWTAVDICDASLRATDNTMADRVVEIVGTPEFAGAVSGLLTQHDNAVRAHSATLEQADATLAMLREAAR